MYSFQPIIRLYPPLHLLNSPFYLRLLHRKACTGLSYTLPLSPFLLPPCLFPSLFPVNRSFERISSTRESSSPSPTISYAFNCTWTRGKEEELRGNKTRQDEVSLVSGSRSFFFFFFFLVPLDEFPFVPFSSRRCRVFTLRSVVATPLSHFLLLLLASSSFSSARCTRNIVTRGRSVTVSFHPPPSIRSFFRPVSFTRFPLFLSLSRRNFVIGPQYSRFYSLRSLRSELRPSQIPGAWINWTFITGEVENNRDAVFLGRGRVINSVAAAGNGRIVPRK